MCSGNLIQDLPGSVSQLRDLSGQVVLRRWKRIISPNRFGENRCQFCT
jgi:hypothetical protein